MIDEISTLKEAFEKELASVSNSEELEAFRIKFLGRNGKISDLFNKMKTLPKEEKPLVGKELNIFRRDAENAFKELQDKIASDGSSEAAAIDLTLPGRKQDIGSLHILTQTLNEMADVFIQLGFSVITGPELESDYYNFEALNFPPDHPARDMQDTYFINDDFLLRTHTSPVQIRVMEKQKPPIRAIMPGKVYRNEAISARSSNMFHQLEGLYIDEHVTFAELKGTLVAFARQYYGENIAYRFRASYFPFTEPSAEMDITCFLCEGKGCRVCKYTGWLEILGCGMVDPNVLKSGGIDPEEYTGYAFGMGIERTAMLKHNITDIRTYFDNDIRFLKQF